MSTQRNTPHIQEADASNDPWILPAFLEYLGTIKGVSPGTLRSYQYDLRLLMRFLLVQRGVAPARDGTPEDLHAIDISSVDAQVLASVTLGDLHAFLSHVGADRANSARTRSRKVDSIRSFFTWMAEKAELLPTNPALELESPKFQRRKPRYLNLTESRRLITAIRGRWPERDFAILTLFLNSGIRLSELVGINLEDMQGNRIRILGKGRKERTVYLNEACRAALAAYFAVRPTCASGEQNALFLSERKKRMAKNTVQFLVKKHIGVAGLDTEKYSTHKLRHTAATLMYQHGAVDIRALQEILGHDKLSTTVIYTHLDEKQLRDAVESNPLAKVRPARNAYTDTGTP